MIQGRRSRPVHAPFFLAHGDYSLPGSLRGGEMNVTHLRQGVAHGVVNRAFADFAALDARVDREAVFLDLVESVAKLRRKVRPEGDDFQIHGVGLRQIVQRPVEMTVVGPGGSDDGDGSLHKALGCGARADARTTSLGRYSGTSRHNCSRTPATSRRTALSFSTAIALSNCS